MYQVRAAIDTSMAQPRSTRAAVPACDVTHSRHAFAARPWHGSINSTMPSLAKGHEKGLEAILGNGTRRLKEPST